MSDSAAVATTTPPSSEEIAQIRRGGAAMVAQKQEVKELYRTLEGMEWGSGSQAVKGNQFSSQTRYALAQFCRVTRANPMTQVDILGGKPYLNANYWKERITHDPLFVDLQQKEISEATEAALREKAEERREAYEWLRESDPQRAGEQLTRALDLEDEADYIARARAHWSPPEWATAIYETTIRRFMNAAPLDAIKAGDIPMEEADRWIIEVKECNWAGNRPEVTKKRRDGSEYTYQPDPIGNEEAEKTARTRSLRRCATQAFSAWMAPYEEQIHKAEEAIEAEWELVVEDGAKQAAALPAPEGPQAVSTGGGEPEAANPQGARPLPGDPEEIEEPPEQPPTAEATEDSPAFDRRDAQKRFFATLRDAGITDRKAWQQDNGFPESSKDFTQADFDRVQTLLVDPVKQEVRDLLNAETREEAVEELEDLSLDLLGKSRPDFLADWNTLVEFLREAEPTEDVPEEL